MLKLKNKKAQAAVELAVFGAILIFLLGAIVRSAMSNSYLQNQNFKAMRIAMLASWNGSKAQNTARNNASVLFIEDRLSPDFNKYGVLDRNPLIANGSGTFTYMLLYPLTGGPGETICKQICRSWTFISTASIFLLPPRPMLRTQQLHDLRHVRRIAKLLPRSNSSACRINSIVMQGNGWAGL